MPTQVFYLRHRLSRGKTIKRRWFANGRFSSWWPPARSRSVGLKRMPFEGEPLTRYCSLWYRRRGGKSEKCDGNRPIRRRLYCTGKGTTGSRTGNRLVAFLLGGDLFGLEAYLRGYRIARAALGSFVFAGALQAQTPGRVDFGRDVLPIFRQNCVTCHIGTQPARGMRLDRN